MSGIKRWDWVNKMVRGDDHGRFVKYADHAAEIARLRAEADALRVDAERYRWLREYDVDSYLAGGKCESLDSSIDAAMGADA